MNATASPSRSLFGLRFDALNMEQATVRLSECIGQRPTRVVVTPNVDHLVSLQDQPELKALYATADHLFADGMPLVWTSRLVHRALHERVTGADLFTALCRMAQQKKWRVAIFGGMPGQQALLMDRFAQVYPGLQVDLRIPGMGFDYRSDEGQAAVDWVKATQPDLLFVCLGFPRQCLWSLHNRDRLNTGLVLCVGAAMEFALGLRARAPLWMQRGGLEWLWRLCSEPGKLWRRYLVRGPLFLGLVWQEWRRRR